MPGIAELLQGAFGAGQPAGNQAGTPPERGIMYFTSRLRSGLSVSNTTNIFVTGQGGDTANQAVTNQAADFFKTSSFLPVIGMSVNPNSITFTQPKRFTKKDTRQGSVYFHFTNTRGQNNDILTLAFKGNTGNIDLRGSKGDSNLNAEQNQGLETGALQKFLVWHNLYLLTREPMLLWDGSENVFSISYSSKLFPEVIFNGFFNKVLEFEENGRKPNSQDYGFEFTVTSTIPELDEVLAQIVDLASTPSTATHVPFPAGVHGTHIQSAGAVIEAATPGSGGSIIGPVETGDTEDFSA